MAQDESRRGTDEAHEDVESSRGRILAVGALLGAAGLIAYVLLGGADDEYVLAPALTPEEAFNGLTEDQRAKCPGANERNPGDDSTPFTENGELDCDPTEVPPGP